MKLAQETEPPSSLHSTVFMVAQDSHGNWVVQDQDGIRGGLFVDRIQALRFVLIRFCDQHADALIGAIAGAPVRFRRRA